MPKDKKKIKKHIEVIEAYQRIWKSARSDTKEENSDGTLEAARDYENFSGIEKLIERFLKKQSFEHHFVLSLGCGAAKDLVKIRELFPSTQLFGIDTSRDALREARSRRLQADFSTICASIDHLPFRRTLRFDMLVAGQTLDLEFEEAYLKSLLTEATKYASIGSRFYMTFYGTRENDLILYTLTPIGNLLEKLGWNIVFGVGYHNEESPFAKGVFWIAEKPSPKKQE